MGARLVSISYTPTGIERKPADHYARVAFERATLVADLGIEGDRKARSGRRQMNVVRAEVVRELAGEGFRTGPGELGEQLVVEGLPADVFVDGARIRIGDSALIELTMVRTPCDRFEHIQGKPIECAMGRIGFMARVVEGGAIALGDPVRVMAMVER